MRPGPVAAANALSTSVSNRKAQWRELQELAKRGDADALTRYTEEIGPMRNIS